MDNKVGWQNPPGNKKAVHLKVEGESYTACGRNITQNSKFVSNVNFNENKDVTTCSLCLNTQRYKRLTAPVRKIVVKQCKECPRCYPAMGNEVGWYCSQANQIIAKDISTLDVTVIPHWCPLDWE